MIRHALNIVVLAIALASGCAITRSNVPQCAAFFAEGSVPIHSFPHTFDLEQEHSLNGENITQRYQSIPSLRSGCHPGEISPDPPQEIMSPWPDAPAYVDARAGITQGVRWIQFIYPRISEEGMGLESSVVFYSEQGTPTSTKFAALYLSWEDATNIKSEFKNGVITYCKQRINFSLYDENGDILSPLPSPERSSCEVSTDTYP